MNEPWDNHTKWSKSEWETQIQYDITYKESKYDTKEIYKTETDLQTQNRLVVAKRKVGWGRDGLGIWG